MSHKLSVFKALLIILIVKTGVFSNDTVSVTQTADSTLIQNKSSAVATTLPPDSLRSFQHDSLQSEYAKYVQMEKEGVKKRIKGGILIGVVAPLTLIASAGVLALVVGAPGDNSFIAIVPALGVVGIGAGGYSLRMKGKRMIKKARYFKKQIEPQLKHDTVSTIE